MYKYKLMPSAVEDLQEIADYIEEQLSAPESAIQLLEKWRKRSAWPGCIPASPSAGKRRISCG